MIRPTLEEMRTDMKAFIEALRTLEDTAIALGASNMDYAKMPPVHDNGHHAKWCKRWIR